MLSVLVHFLLVTGGLLIARAHLANAPAPVATPAVQLAELAPLPPYRPAPRSILQEQRPPDRPMPRPQVRRGKPLPEDVTVHAQPPPDAEKLGEAPPAMAPAPPQPRAAPQPRDTAQLAAAQPTMESEAQRLFGRKQPGASAAGPVQNVRWAQQVTDDRPNDCVPRPLAALAIPEMGEIAGTVFKEGSSEPLPGAFLQIIGTAFSAFADERGRYRLTFDRALVDECRTQYVQVSKDGFRPRRLILGLGPQTSNDVPMSRR